ncbi:HAD-like protein [Metschnikowia bicuspidata var. bicuspidata NRRL YB-4993]|uniref:HAD-like protein n=1 Tax=Metschnikowia bicuspidata var. bicuspidata NRRL YB-4993 TaxID=869754 RepID=A0A1A0H721_9ASCO|nr:HAD-like protein [Metschnikowia bicuspidata var. bicuspidata NRRL YB-4993]OBA19755.1 HAD-like protein [Metschnikowia bicuspidata var. bicuspidata NRRL YB-4993]
MAQKQFKACLFDLDGTLLNTEDIYTEGTSKVLAKYGKGPLTWDIKLDLQGRPGPEATRNLLNAYGITEVTPEQYMEQAFEVLQDLWGTSDWLEGALPLLSYMKEKNIPVALGTGSNLINYKLKTDRLSEHFEIFGHHVVTGDDPRIPPGRGKPNPDIWHVCLESLNQQREKDGLESIAMEECLVFEDGIPGVLSGKNANATVIWVPHPGALAELKGKEKDILSTGGEILPSLAAFDPTKYGF